MSMQADAAARGQAPGAQPKANWRDRLFERRNRLLAQPHFQRGAAKFPLTRGIATARAAGLFDLCAGFVYSQILFACVEIKLFEKLSDGPLSLETIAGQCGFAPERMRRLLDAADALKLVERRPDGSYGLGIHGAAALGNPAVAAMIAHHDMLYRDLADPVAVLKGEKVDTELSKFWPYATSQAPHELTSADVEPYSALMSSSQALIADDLLDAYRFVEHGTLLDIGGGSGDFLIAAAHRRPDLRVVLFDLPAVATEAEARFKRERLGGRSRAVGGDFRHDPLPSGADLVSLVRVAHDLDDADLDALLAKIFVTLPPGGILLLAEPMAGTAGAERVGAYFEMYLLAMQRGRPRTVASLTKHLYRAGFARARYVTTPRPMLTGLLVAQKSAGPRNRAVRQD